MVIRSPLMELQGRLEGGNRTGLNLKEWKVDRKRKLIFEGENGNANYFNRKTFFF